jgi:hypothetical protein
MKVTSRRSVVRISIDMVLLGIHLTREDEYVSLQSLGADTVTDVEIPFEGALDGESVSIARM